MIEAACGLPTTSTGAILRREKEAGTELGLRVHELTSKGQFAPDDVVLALVKNWLDSLPAPGDAFVFDGFPRTLAQGEELDRILSGRGTPLQLALHLDLNREEIERRVLNRRVCASCRHSANLGWDIAAEGDPCPKCGGRLEPRADDSLPVLERRLNIYTRLTEPLLPYYERQGLLASVDVSVPKPEAMSRIAALIGCPLTLPEAAPRS